MHGLQVLRNDSRNLPGLATANDVREMVQFLSRYEDGLSIIEALDGLRRRIFDQRRLEAYEFWGLIVRTGDRIRLTDCGWELARLRAPEANFFRKLLTCNPTYWSTLEWIHSEGMQLVTTVELHSFWTRSGLDGVHFSTDEQLESSVASFLQLCNAAELGTFLVGRKGQPTRLHLDSEKLAAILNPDPRSAVDLAGVELFPRTQATVFPVKFKSPRDQRVFISAPSDGDSVKRFKEIFALAAVDYDWTHLTTDDHTSISDTIEQMARCDSGIVVLTSAACNAEGQLSAETLILLGAAMMHFQTRLVLLLENGLSLPPNLAVASHRFDTEVSWDLAVQLLSFVRQAEQIERSPERYSEIG